ncbi:hypothetical protein [Paenibacillus sp. Marseille-Q4541]|uniref:hypothetical protein n=1 Tax=Paenibacillus sp. Marseille-Q4541 TaxID=2831522 RepID=UPI001BA57457|nr:hypothetical protein [Paenibacillus sp. Marseille-Q4541]
MPFIGGIILVVFLAFVVWMLLTPIFNKVGEKVTKKYGQFTKEENANDEESEDV